MHLTDSLLKTAEISRFVVRLKIIFQQKIKEIIEH